MKMLRPIGLVLVALTACETEQWTRAKPWQGDLPSRAVPSLFGETVTSYAPTAPISGGTLLVLSDQRTAIASDPDRDLVYVVDLVGGTVQTVALALGDEPGRVAVDASGRAHVALRSGGAVVTIDVGSAKIVRRDDVCPAPRGIAYDSASGAVYVACVGGEIVALDTESGAQRMVARLDRDLRDVVFDGDELLVSRFRSPELIHLLRDGTVVRTEAPAPKIAARVPSVAWRTIGMPNGGAAMVHQLARVEVPSVQQYYGFDLPTSTPSPSPAPDVGLDHASDDPCGGSVVENTVTFFGAAARFPSRGAALMPDAVLPVDVAVSGDGMRLAVVAAGNAYQPGRPTVLEMADVNAPLGFCASMQAHEAPAGEATALAFAGDEIVVQLREPAMLFRMTARVAIPLSPLSRKDTGHALFHANSGKSIACASCHAEGGDDGKTWNLPDAGPRRSPSLRGTLRGTAPYHWEGDLRDMPALFDKVLVQRMGGPTPLPGEAKALQAWLERLSPPRPLGTEGLASTRGKSLFAERCASCHSGTMLTNNTTVDVGTGDQNAGGAFQVPSLVGTGWHAPYMHNGSAATLEHRFTGSTPGHGDMTGLTKDDIADLVAFLDML